MAINLLDHQKKAVLKLRSGSILLGGVGSGKSLTALSYYYNIECGGSDMTSMKRPKDLYIITTAQKRDSFDWEDAAAYFRISNKRESSINGVLLTVDSWNNISKHINITNAFFIFDEQKVVGYGTWAKSFIKITKNNNWILLTATPGDKWEDYIPVFIANNFYKNKTEFTREHLVYNSYTKYPKIERYLNESKLERLKRKILIVMDYKSKAIVHNIDVVLPYDVKKFHSVLVDRWNDYINEPIRNGADACYVMRMVVNSDPSRISAILDILKKHRRLIIFYNFDYELDILRKLNDLIEGTVAEYNGHLHEPIPNTDSWVYLVQYTSGAEAMNCIETNAIVFYSLNYSFKTMVQAAGRIDRMNTTFLNLYYYYLRSNAPIDNGILRALREKRNFNETQFLKEKEYLPF